MQPAIAPLLGAQATPPKAAAAAKTPEIDGGWPRDRATPSGGSVRIFQPQVASWDGQRHMVAYAALAYTAKGATTPALGTVTLEADTSVAVDERLVNFSNVKLTATRFSSLPNDQLREVTATLTQDVPQGALMIALDRVLARLDKSQIIPRNVVGVKADPPTIFYSTSPAILVNLDGDPIWSPIKENDLKFAVNTNWDLFQNEPTKTFYLRDNQSWLSATDVKGTVEAGRQAAGRLRETAGRRQLEGREGGAARSRAGVDAQGARQHDADRADSPARRAELYGRERHRVGVGLQHGQ